MKHLLPYLLSLLVIALLVSTINISINPKRDSNTYLSAPANPRDSFMKAEQLRRQLLKDEGSGIDFFSFGTRKIENTNQYFLRLGEYYREPGVSFDIENGNSIYRYPANTAANGMQHAGYKEQVIPVRYAYDPFLDDHLKGAVLLPVSKSNYTILQVFTFILTLAAVILILYFGFYKFLLVLVDIARGKGFSHKNTSRLFVAGWTFLLVPIIPLLLLQVADWYFASSIPSGLSFSFFRSLSNGHWTHILLGTVVLATALAFEKGTKMKNELDTVV